MFEIIGKIIIINLEICFKDPRDDGYMVHLRDLLWRHLGEETVLITCDAATEASIPLSGVNGALMTANFGVTPWPVSVPKALALLRKFQKKGPLVDSEFYPGWITHWGFPHSADVSVPSVVKCLEGLLEANASFVMYV